MALTQTQVLPAQFIQDAGLDYATQLAAATAAPLPTQQFAPTVAGQTGLQQQATSLAGTQGLGIGALEQYLTAAEPYAGPDAYKQFMSPYQQQVIDATMTSFDKRAAMQRRGISDQALQAGAYGGARHGIAGSEYDAASDMNGGVVVIGNAPTALLEVIKMIQEKVTKPALIIGIPVGFVSAVESKEELQKIDVPFITNIGRKGGSSCAASIVNALFKLLREN